MEQVIDEESSWKRSWMPKKGDRAAILQLHKMSYHDQLCKDMAVNPCRKGWNLLAETFAPYSAADYVDLFPRSDEAVASAAEMEARHGGFCARAGARAVLAVAFVAVVLAFLASGGSLKSASLAGAVVLASPTLFEVAKEPCIAPMKMLLSSSVSSSRVLPRLSLLSQSTGC